MKELEFLLNLLLEMGRKPYGQTKFKRIKISSNIYNETKRRIIVEFDGGDFGNYYKLCDVVSINSGLWQFVCENKLVKQSQKQRVLNPTFGPEGADCDWSIQSNDFQYRLLGSALIPEEELRQFLLDNIKAECHLKYEIKLD